MIPLSVALPTPMALLQIPRPLVLWKYWFLPHAGFTDSPLRIYRFKRVDALPAFEVHHFASSAHTGFPFASFRFIASCRFCHVHPPMGSSGLTIAPLLRLSVLPFYHLAILAHQPDSPPYSYYLFRPLRLIRVLAFRPKLGAATVLSFFFYFNVCATDSILPIRPVKALFVRHPDLRLLPL